MPRDKKLTIEKHKIFALKGRRISSKNLSFRASQKNARTKFLFFLFSSIYLLISRRLILNKTICHRFFYVKRVWTTPYPDVIRTWFVRSFAYVTNVHEYFIQNEYNLCYNFYVLFKMTTFFSISTLISEAHVESCTHNMKHQEYMNFCLWNLILSMKFTHTNGHK